MSTENMIFDTLIDTCVSVYILCSIRWKFPDADVDAYMFLGVPGVGCSEAFCTRWVLTSNGNVRSSC
jgi:hypothetical protein